RRVRLISVGKDRDRTRCTISALCRIPWLLGETMSIAMVMAPERVRVSSRARAAGTSELRPSWYAPYRRCGTVDVWAVWFRHSLRLATAAVGAGEDFEQVAVRE